MSVMMNMMKRLWILLSVIALSGCVTVLKINNKTDPQNFDPIIIGAAGSFYDEISVEVPSEIREEDFTVTRVDIAAKAYVNEVTTLGELGFNVDLYISLDSGREDLDDPARSQLLASVLITEEDVYYPVEIVNPGLAHRAFKQKKFYMKTVITSANPTLGTVHIEDVFLNIWLERETKGLLPFFYMF
jgi:hypothetical protein